MRALGIDVSHWDEDWNAEKAKAAGAVFVFIKSSQNTFTDSQFVSNWSKARRAGLLRGAYHYLDYRAPARKQANYFATLLNADPGELPPVVDFEQRPTGTTVSPIGYLKDFVEQLQSLGYTPIIYTSPGFWREYGSRDAYWRRFKLWVAHYTKASAPDPVPPWQTWTFWQYSSKGHGTLYGSESYDMDLNWFNGSLEDLYALAGVYNPNTDLSQRVGGLEKRLSKLERTVGEMLSALEGLTAGGDDTLPPQPSDDETPPDGDESDGDAAPPPDPIPTQDVLYGECIAEVALNVRNGPGVQFKDIAYILRGQRVRVLEQRDGWARIEEPAGWVSLKYLRLETVSEPLETPPPDETPPEPDDVNPQADPVLPTAPGVYAFCQQETAVHSGPSGGFSRVGVLKEKDVVQIVAQQNGWSQIAHPAGWVPQSALKIVTQAVTIARSLNVRQGPGADHPAVDWLVMGQPVRIIQMQKDWAYIYAPTGWCLSAYLERQYSPGDTQYALSILRDLTVYKEASDAAQQEGQLAFGQRVAVLEEKDGWARVQAPIGWCYNAYLQFK